MTDSSVPQAETEAGIATAEGGFVILDGPDGIAVTMTPEAALRTGENLISAAEEAERQICGGSNEPGV